MSTTSYSVNLPINTLSSLAEELSRVAQALGKVSKNLQTISSLKTVRVTPKTDPEMYTAEFLKTIRQSRKELEKGEFTDYLSFRKSLGL